jgi:hypothetical protein
MRVARRRGDVWIELDAVERDLLAALTTQLDEVLHDEDGDDPVHDRLFPTAYRDDVEAAAEFRRYTHEGLRDRKSANAGRVAAGVAASADGRVRLDADAMDAWLPALTDLRLVIAERLGVRADDEPLPDTRLAAVYLWLGELQARLVDAIER